MRIRRAQGRLQRELLRLQRLFWWTEGLTSAAMKGAGDTPDDWI